MEHHFYIAKTVPISYPYAVTETVLRNMMAKENDPERKALLAARSRAWRAANPERAREIGRASGKRLRDAKAIAEGREPGRMGHAPVLTEEERKAKRKAFDDKNNAIKKQQAAERALAEGREPGRVGRPPRLTAEEKEASRIAQNKRRSKRTAARTKANRAARALAEGRQPGQVGQPRVLSDEERILRRRQSFTKWRQENIETVRERNNAQKKAKTAARAIAEGRVPGVIGHLATFSAEELARYLISWPDRTDVFHGRIKTHNSRAKRLGVPGELTLLDVRACLEEQEAHCAFCFTPFGDETPEIDHWIPLAGGGTNTADNIRLLHLRCNRTKGAKHPTTFGLPDSPLPLRALTNPSPQKGD